MFENPIIKKFKKQNVYDRIFFYLTAASAAAVLIIFLGILVYLIIGSLPALRAFGFNFLTNSQWNPVTKNFGALNPILGTITTSIIALIIAIPISFGIAVFLTEISPIKLREPLRIIIELLAGIPSIIYGMWGLFIFAPFFAQFGQPWLIEHIGNIPLLGVLFQGTPMGIGLLTAGIILGIMVIPFIASVMRDVFEIVPEMLKESAFAMGATKWEVIWKIIIPYTRIAVIGGITLGLGRALGETMAVAFVIGNAHLVSFSLLMPGNTITSVLANEFTEATGSLYSASLIELGLILFVITFIVLVFSRLLLLRFTQKPNKEAQ
jgi:phosphate transport system permease protein